MSIKDLKILEFKKKNIIYVYLKFKDFANIINFIIF